MNINLSRPLDQIMKKEAIQQKQESNGPFYLIT